MSRRPSDFMNGLALLEELWNTHVVRVEPFGRAFLYKDCLLVYEVTSPQAFAFKDVQERPLRRENRDKSPGISTY
jgi:homoaconitase/3-isopropylmalate dehydratase large subunit